MEQLKILITNNRKPIKKDNFGFGKDFTDHMFVMDYDVELGWHNPTIVPYGPIEFYPSSSCLHYSQEVFEGLKGFRANNNDILLFRPDQNFKRLNQSCDRLKIPQFDEKFMLECLLKLVDIDRDWVPYKKGTSLYIRPFIIATEPFLGVHPSSCYKFFIIMSPSGQYYEKGLSPVKIYVEQEYVRAVKGGTGAAKTGGNYAASLKAQYLAAKKGFDQVLWLDGKEHKYIEEVGAMNIFFKIKGEIVTPKLNGSILPGITRKSVIELLENDGFTVNERDITIDEVVDCYKKGTLEEAFGTGTAAVISPVGELYYNDISMIINDNKIGKTSKELYETLTGIQYGEIKYKNNFVLKV